MNLVSILLVVICAVNVGFGATLDNIGSDENENFDEPTTESSIMDHSFVALIDIVFTDGSKRTCTGSIIHDNVVITAAHCFKIEKKPSIKPEITASFVVIGTKKMFETDYEQYLPIERVITHPRFNGWTADLSLVFTFAGMTSDKPGTIIPLAGEKTSTHVDANVTVLSWGHMKEIESQKDWISSKQEKCDYTSQEDTVDWDKSEKDQNKKGKKKAKVTALLQYRIKQRSIAETTTPVFKEEIKILKQIERENSYNILRSVREKTQNNQYLASFWPKSKLISRYLSSEERETSKPNPTRRYRSTTSKRSNTLNDEESIYEYDEGTTISNHDIFRYNHSVTHSEPENKFKSYYSNWRRQMGSQQNQLTVEMFGFVNVQACKKLVERAMPPQFDISDGNDVVCYAAEDHFISNKDSGAPAIRRGQLVAVTIGGAELEGEHVAVGMKMSCYCTWIADNLPNGGDNFHCCKNCCDVKHKEVINPRSSKRKNKYESLKNA